MGRWREASHRFYSACCRGRDVLCLLMALPLMLTAGEGAADQKTQLGGQPADPEASALQRGTPRKVAPAKPEPAASAQAPRELVTRTRLVETYGKLPLRFEANQGQTDRQVQFLSRGRGYGLFLTPNEAVLALQGGKSEVKGQKSKVKNEKLGIAGLRIPSPESRTPAILRMKLVGAESAPRIQGLEELPGKSNYFIGNDPKQWRTGVPNYKKVRYEGVYPGVDLVYYGNQGKLEYDWVVAPGTDPKKIKFAIEGTEKVSLDPQGDLVLGIEGGEVRFHKPVVYQEESGVRSQESVAKGEGQRTNDARQFIDGRYVLRASNPKSKIQNPKYEVAFEVGPYDRSKPLVIDPTFDFSRLFGAGSETAYAIAVDGSGVYLAGTTFSTGLATSGAYDETCGTDDTCNGIITVSTIIPQADAFVAKLSADGSSVLYSTYLGGSTTDEALGLAVDSAGNAYVTGYTLSLADFPDPNFPVPGGYTTSNGTLYVVKLSADGSNLIYSARFGGSNFEVGAGIAIYEPTAGTAYAYVGGYTYSTDFPTTTGAFQETYPGGVGACGISTTFDCPHGFVVKLKADGSAPDYSTYLGGGLADYVYGVAVDGSGNAYAAGVTQSSGFPTTSGAFQETFGGETTNCDVGATFCGDAFITELNPAGSGLSDLNFSTFVGGSGNENLGLGSVALDGSGHVIVAGQTNSTEADFPVTTGAYQTTQAGLDDAFVAAIDTTGASTSYVTFLGGSGFDVAESVARYSNGSVYVSGSTDSTNFPTANAIQGSCASCGGEFPDAFVAKFNSTLSGLIFSDYLGGAGTEDAFGIAVDGSGNAYVTGTTSSSDFPTSVGPSFPGGSVAFVAKFSGLILPVVSVSPSSFDFASVCALDPTSCNVGNVTAVQPITIKNLGDKALNFSSFNVGANDSLPGSGDFPSGDSIGSPCGASLAAGAPPCIYNVRFQPSATGTRDAILTITDDDRGVAGTTQTVTLTGFATQPIISATPSSLNFGVVPVGTDSSTMAVNISNIGTGPLTMVIAVGGGTPFSQVTGGAGVCSAGFHFLSPDTSCDVVVKFHPTAVGLAAGTLTLSSDDTTNPVIIIGLSGTGISSGVAGGLTTFNFGSLLIGKTSSAHRFTLTNSGSGALGITNIELTGNYNLAPTTTCPIGGSVATSASCFIDVTFTAGSPTNPGTLLVYHDGTNSNESSSPLTATLSGTGTTLTTNTLVAFAPKTDYATGTTPFGGAGDDLNSDGTFDLVIANYGSNNVSVFLGNAAVPGTFLPRVDYPAGTNPTSVEISDVTGDGIFDLIVTDQNAANPAAGAVQLLAGNGNGTFQPAVSLGTFNGPNSVVSGDFNHDGFRDLAIAEGGGGAGTTVAVLLGTGSGNFQSPVTYTVPVNPDSIAKDDFNGDGNADLAVLSNIGSLSILLGNGNGTFSQPLGSPFTTGSFPNGRMAIADFDGDGDLDIAVAQNGSNSVGVFLNNGSGAFPTRTDYAATGARAVSTADFNGDGKFDLAVAGQSAGVVWILIGNGDGTFRTPALSFPTTATPKDVGGVDLNGDGMPDLAVAGSLSILINTPALFSTYSLSFGSHLVGSTTTLPITLTNASNTTPLTVTSITPSGDFDSSIPTCASPIAVGDPPCTIDVVFTPTALGPQAGTLSISTGAAGSPHTINLTGTGTGTPAVSLSPAVNFPGNPVGKPDCPIKTVTLSNAGDIPLTFVSATVPPGSPFTITNSCPTTLDVGVSLPCIQVQFIPTVEGSASETLTVTTSPAAPGNTVLLTGTGTPACALLAKVRSATLLRGTDSQDFDIADAKPSCSPVSLNLSCSVANPAACALNPAVIPPSGASTLRVSNLKAVAAESVDVRVNSTSEFRAASELITVRFSDFAFTSAPDSASILAGETATYSVAIRPINGLSGQLSLACGGAPKGATCTVSPASLTLDGSSLATARVNVTTAGRSMASPPAGNPGTGPDIFARLGWQWLTGLLFFLVLAALPARRRTGLVLAAAMLLVLVWAACGGGGFVSNVGPGGTVPGTYKLTVTGTFAVSPSTNSSVLIHETTLSLKVN